MKPLNAPEKNLWNHGDTWIRQASGQATESLLSRLATVLGPRAELSLASRLDAPTSGAEGEVGGSQIWGLRLVHQQQFIVINMVFKWIYINIDGFLSAAM